MNGLTVVIPTLNAGASLQACIAAVAGSEAVTIVDGGSSDDTVEIAERSGATVCRSVKGRGSQFCIGARTVTSDWMLFLHADTILQPGWGDEVAAFMAQPANLRRAAVFRFALDDPSPQARRLERMVGWRCRVLALPYGDQGLLISRTFYDELGGFRPLPIMEDVDIIRRIGHGRLARFATLAVTSADRWRREGWLWRSSRNLLCLTLYAIGVPPRLIAEVYGR